MNFLKKLLLVFIIFYIGYIMYATVYYFSTTGSRAQYTTPTPALPISLIPPQPVCRSGIKSILYHDRCGKKQDGTYNKANFTCLDNSRGEFRSKNCLTDAEFKQAAFTSCQSLAKCPTPTATPTPSYNTPPTISTNYLPYATLGQNYSAEIVALDKDGDSLIMNINALPPGITQGPCQLNPQPISIPPVQTTGAIPPPPGGYISCTIYGTPTQSGFFNVHISVQDKVNDPVLKLVSMSVGPVCPSLTPPPCPAGYLQRQDPSPTNGLTCPIYRCIPLNTSVAPLETITPTEPPLP